MRITFAWWNTSLSPLGKPRATEQDRSFAQQVVLRLVEQFDVDCLALGEVTFADLRSLRQHESLHEFVLYDGTSRRGHLQFDGGLLYRRTQLELLEEYFITTRRGARNLKVANRIDVISSGSRYPLHLFVSHWPSRLWCETGSPDRHLLGARLRDEVEKVANLHERPSSIILLGDYNDEPFDSSLAEQVLASRDRHLVRKRPEMFYNPFWRHMGERDPHVPGREVKSVVGSSFYAKGRETRWRTFNQMIFSSAFLGTGEWQLQESRTGIVRTPSLEDAVMLSGTIFDHFPVIGTIEKETEHGD